MCGCNLVGFGRQKSHEKIKLGRVFLVSPDVPTAQVGPGGGEAPFAEPSLVVVIDPDRVMRSQPSGLEKCGRYYAGWLRQGDRPSAEPGGLDDTERGPLLGECD